MKGKKYAFLLIISILFLLNIYQYLNYINLTGKFNEINTNYEKFSNITKILNGNTILRKESRIWYHSTWDNHFYSILYNNNPNSTLEISISIMQPQGKIIVPLSIQKGYATQKEYATSEYVFYHINFSDGKIIPYILPAAPVEFFKNVTEPSSFRITLRDRGWYTLSIFGPISLNDRFYGVREINVNETIFIESNFDIKENNEKVIFAEVVEVT